MNKRLRPCRDAAIFRAYETRALKARRDRFARRYAADVIARATARRNEHARMVRTRGSHTSFSSKIPVSAPEAARNDEIAGWIAMWCARARYIVNTYIHTYVLTLTRAKRTTAFLRGERVSVPQSRCQGQAPRSRLPAHLLATAFRIELPTLLLDRAKRS